MPLQHTDTLPDAQQQFEATAREDLEQNGIRWLGPARFGNQYAVARRTDATGALASVDSLSDLRGFVAGNEDEATFCCGVPRDAGRLRCAHRAIAGPPERLRAAASSLRRR